MLWWVGCAQQEGTAPSGQTPPAAQPTAQVQEDLELAKVGETRITVKQLREFYADLPDYLQSGKAGLDKERNHLQTLIDVELLQLEAQAQNIEQTPAFVRKWNRLRKDRLVGFYQVRNIQVRIAPEDIQNYFTSQKLSRAVRFSDIVVPSQDSARAVRRELAKGKSFAEVAGKWSIRKSTARHGGDSGVFATKLEITPQLRDALFALKVGEVSAPLDVGGAFAVFQASEEKQKELDPHLTQVIYKELFLKEYQRRRSALADSLKAVYHLAADRQGWDRFFQLLRAEATPTDEEAEKIALYQYDGGTITAADLLATAEQRAEEDLDLKDRKAALDFAERAAVPDALFMAAAVQAGMEREEEVAKWLAQKRVQLVVTQLRVQVLAERISISEEELQAHYAANPDRYTKLEQMEIQEVLVATQEEAQRLAERVQKGESLGELARQHSLRPRDQRDEEGRMNLYISYSKALHRELAEAAREATQGELVGPVETREGYSLFKVLSRQGERESFDEAKKRVQATVNWIKKQQVFESYLAELRDKYAAQVEVQEDNLKRALAAH